MSRAGPSTAIGIEFNHNVGASWCSYFLVASESIQHMIEREEEDEDGWQREGKSGLATWIPLRHRYSPGGNSQLCTNLGNGHSPIDDRGFPQPPPTLSPGCAE